MKRRIVAAMLCMGVAMAGMIGCGSQGEEKTSNKTEESTETEGKSDEKKYPELNLNPTEAMSVNGEGVKAASPSEFILTDEEIETLKAGNYTAAFCYHTQSDTCNQNKLKAAEEMLESWGIEVVSVTDANFDAATQTSQIESTMALDPDVLFVMPYDADACASALDENVATGYQAEKDYVGCASSDSYGNGKACADILAKEIGYKGTVAMMYYDLVYPVTNERDRGFRETIEKDYPDIEIVVESGFTDPNDTGTVADAILARYPDVDGVYASWDIPAEGMIASAESVGREDIIITCCDLGDTAAKSIATDGMIRGSGAPRSPEQGEAEALLAAYALLGKEMPSTFATPPALPVIQSNVLDAYEISYGVKAPEWLQELAQ